MRNQQSAKLDRDQQTSHTSVTTKAHPRPHALEDYQSEDELAQELDRSPRTLARWRAARIGPPYVEIGRRIFYRRAGVAEWLLKRERGGFDERKDRGRAVRRGA
jgi:hypothetical protein